MQAKESRDRVEDGFIEDVLNEKQKLVNKMVTEGRLANPWIENGHNNVNARESKATMVDIRSDEFEKAVVKIFEALMDAKKHKKKLKKAQKKYDKKMRKLCN